MLPTDERYKALSDIQIALLFGHWLHSVPEDALKDEYWRSKRAAAKSEEQKLRADDLREMGYDEAAISEILKELGNG